MQTRAITFRHLDKFARRKNGRRIERIGGQYGLLRSPGTAHEWQTWRSDLNDFLSQLFR